jgi:radical SAM superfamily enzyme YgiQ (UPF0313 family)
MDSLISTGISVLSSHLRQAGHDVQLYDTTFIDTGKETGDFYREGLGQVIKVDLNSKGVIRNKMEPSELQKDFRKTVQKYCPGLIGFSTLEITYDQGLYLSRGIEDLDIPVLFGGIYPTFAPRIVLKEPSIDMICEGEGEELLPELATALENGDDVRPILNLTIKHKNGKVYRSGEEILLEDLPTGDDFRGQKTGLRRPQTHMGKVLQPPDYSIYEDKRFWKKMGGKIVRTVAMELSRGCPFKCTFCCVPMQQKQHKASKKQFQTYLQNNKIYPVLNEPDPYHREKPIGKFIDELKLAQETYEIDFVYFTDESFLSMNIRRFWEFIEAYSKFKLPFFIESRVETVKPGFAEALENVGCTGVAMGVESGSLEVRKNLLKRMMPDSVIVQGFKEFEKTNIRISANNIIGFPGESRDDIFRTIKINRQINPDSIVVNAFRPYSGTELRQICIEKGIIPAEERAEDNRVYGAFYNGVLPAEELEGIRKVFAFYVKFPEERWNEIKVSESDEKAFESLQEEFLGLDMLHREKRLRTDKVEADEIFIND